MASFPKMVLTAKGASMIADAAEGTPEKRLIITKIKLGKGKLGGDDSDESNVNSDETVSNIYSMSEVIKPVMEVPLSGIKVERSQAIATFVFDNSNLEAGFYCREIGMYAKSGTDGSECLVMYSNAGNKGTWYDDKTHPIPKQVLNLAFGVSNADNVELKIVDGGIVTPKRLDEFKIEVASMIEQHNNDPSAHGGLLNKMNQAISDHRTMAELDHPAGSVKEKHLAEASVGRLQLKDGSVYGNVIKNDGITNNHLASNSIGQRQLQGSCIDYSNIKSRGIYEDNLASACVTAYQLRDGCTTPSKLDRRYAAIEDNDAGAADFRGLTCKQIIRKYPYMFTRYGSDTKGKSAPLQWSWVLTGYGSTEVSQLGVGYDGNTERNGAYVRTGSGEQILEERPWEKLAEQSYVLKKLQDYVTKNDIAGYGIKTAVDVISALDSQTLKSLGVRWLMEENGYICFGKLFGGLIIQWGVASNSQTLSVLFPISYSKKCLNIVLTPQIPNRGDGISAMHFYIQSKSTKGFTIEREWPELTNNWIAVGY